MAPATSASADVNDDTSHSSSTPVFVTVNVTASPSFVTTTLTTGGSGSLPTGTVAVQKSTSDIPVGAIAGGTAAGVALALVLVILWNWWGRCIERKKAKERREALAFLEVRENTRKNASSLSHPATSYTAFTARKQRSRKVKFASNAPLSSQSTLRGSTELKQAVNDAEKSTPPPLPVPRPPTPSAQRGDAPRRLEEGLPPPLPRKNPQRERGPISSIAPSEAPSGHHRLVHQASTLSSGSVYSTQSATEERQAAVPSSLLLALTGEGNRRSLLANYLPWNRYRTSIVSNNRLSEYSTGSVYSQFDDQPWESVGFAYGGEEEVSKR